MKKLLFILVLLLSVCLVFTACNKDDNEGGTSNGEENTQETLESVKANPAGAVNNALNNVTEKWVTDEMGVADILKDALDTGSVSLHFSSDELADSSIIDATWYTKNRSENAVNLTLTSPEGTSAYANVWINSTNITANGDLLFGDTTSAYTVRIADLADGEWRTFLSDVFSQYDAGDELTNYINMYYQLKTFEGLDGEIVEILEKLSSDIVSEIKPTVTEENGEIVITYKLTIDNAAAALKEAVNNLQMSDTLLAALQPILCPIFESEAVTVQEIREQLITIIDNAVTSFKEQMEAELVYTAKINAKSEKLTAISLKFAASNKQGEGTVEYSANAAFSDTGLTFTMNGKQNGEEINNGKLEYSRISEGDKSGHKLSASLAVNGETASVNIEATYDKAQGDIAITFDAAIPNEEPVSIAVDGSLTKTENSAKFAIDKITSGENSLNLDCSLTFTKGTAIPAAPANPTDIKTLNAEKWEEILEGMGLSKGIRGDYQSEDSSTVWYFYGSYVAVYTEAGGYYPDFTFDGETITFSGYDYEDPTAVELFGTPLSVTLGDGYIIIDGVRYEEIVYDYSTGNEGDNLIPDYSGI